MKRVLAGVGLVAALGIFGFIAWLNPTAAQFRFSPEQTVSVPLGWLLIFVFVAGVGFALLGVSLQQLGRRVRGWGARRRERQAVRAGEWQQSGAELAWDGEIERGRGLLKKAWRRQPDNAAAALALASSYLDTGEYAAARQVLEEAVSRAPNDLDARYALGEILRRSGERAEAIRMLETVCVQHPRAPRALLALRELYAETHAWNDAARVQETYLQAVSDNGRNSIERTRLLHFRYQAAAALEDAAARAEALSALVQSERDYLPAIVSLGDALIADDRADEARKVWEKAFKAQPRRVLIERLLAHPDTPRDRQRTLSLMQKYQQQLDPDTVYLLATNAALQDGQTDAAASSLKAVSKQDSPLVQRHWGEIHQRRGRVDEALQALARAADATALSTYRCKTCGRSNPEWTAHCPSCDSWDSYD